LVFADGGRCRDHLRPQRSDHPRALEGPADLPLVCSELRDDLAVEVAGVVSGRLDRVVRNPSQHDQLCAAVDAAVAATTAVGRLP
jgi:hypothetical protein